MKIKATKMGSTKSLGLYGFISTGPTSSIQNYLMYFSCSFGGIYLDPKANQPKPISQSFLLR